MLFVTVLALTSGCTGTADNSKGKADSRSPQTSDSLYTVRAALSIFDYQPQRALQIIDSAVIVGNLNEVRADVARARIYGMTVMNGQLDSLLGGPESKHYDTALAIGERVLGHDSVKANPLLRKDLLETLAYSTRMKNDTVGWLRWSRELASLCREQGDVTDALRTEAEIGAALYALGQKEAGMAKLDSAIAVLSEKSRVKNEAFKFNELDALIIALKRKIVILGNQDDKVAETLPLARRITELLNDYGQHPDAYHDGSHREPKNATKREDYIRFYRNQAQNFITAAYSSLGESDNMLTSFDKIERSVREATAREHIARYNALQQQMEAERMHAVTERAKLAVVVIGILALLLLGIVAMFFYKNKSLRRKSRIIAEKNRLLAQQISEAVKYKEMYWEEKKLHSQALASTGTPDLSSMSNEQMFHYINDIIVCEQLFLDPKFERRTIMDRFQLSKERVGAIFSKGSEHAKITNYIQQLRLEYAAHLLVTQPDLSIVQIASQCAFGSHKYFTDRFRQRYGMTPSEFRKSRG